MTFTPTQDDSKNPTTCFTCGRHALGMGIGDPRVDPKYLCEECSMMMRQIKSIRQFNTFEKAAVAYAVDAVGPFIKRYGSDLAEWEEEAAEEFIQAIWVACGDGLRRAVAEEVPF